MKFTDLGIESKLNEKLRRKGIVEATKIQERALPLILEGKDIIGQSKTGTGKTLAFLLPIVQKIDPSKNYPQALILAPTRELAIQIKEETESLIDKDEIKILAAYGGQDVERQIKKLKRGMQIIIATPGRLIDHLRRGSLDLGGVDYLVIDEADEMIVMGFARELEDIISTINRNRQTMLFSATISGQVKDIARRFMRKPIYIEVEADSPTVDKIRQIGIRIENKDKIDRLKEIIDKERPFLMLVFCRTKDRVTNVFNKLKQSKYNVEQLHGDLSQNKRERIMKSFKNADIQILVATDVAARGIDVTGVTHVVNYDLANDSDSYIHRIGRTGRIGNDGMAISFITASDRDKLYQLEKDIGEKLELID